LRHWPRAAVKLAQRNLSPCLGHLRSDPRCVPRRVEQAHADARVHCLHYHPRLGKAGHRIGRLDFLPRSQGESAAAGQMGFLRHSEIYRDESLVTHEAAMHVHVGPTTRRGEFPPAIPRRVSSPAEPVSASSSASPAPLCRNSRSATMSPCASRRQ
jgi:hypothetical protein